MANDSNIIFEARGISKKFGGVTALDQVDLEVHTGKVNVVVGENGAGKSTLMKILSGVYATYGGKLLFKAEEVHFNTPKEAMAQGIAIIHQELNLIPHMTITENIFLGRERRNNFGLLDTKEMHAETKALLARLHCPLSPKALVGGLRVGEQQLVEIAKALLEEAKVLIMDEPTSALSDAEVATLFKIIKSLKDQNVSILYISHKLDELFQIADRFIGLRDGKMVGTIEDAAMAKKEHLIRLMVGRDIKQIFKKEAIPLGEMVLSVENLCLRHTRTTSPYRLKDINFKLRKGEVLGLFGLMGAGRTELLETIYGLHPKEMSGSITLANEKVEIRSVMDAIEHGIGLVPENRKEDGLVLQMDIAKNISMAGMDKVSKNGVIHSKTEVGLAKKYMAALQIKTTTARQYTKHLSGGNQQKVVLAKWLATDPKVLFLDEPTRGIDVHAKNEIYHLINSLAKEGLGLVVVSSELPEIMAISDRILVMCNGVITASFNRGNTHEEEIMQAATRL